MTLLRRVLPALVALASSAFAQHEEQPVMDNMMHGMLLADRLEHAFDSPSDALRFDIQGWAGGDYSRLWVYAEGEKRYGGGLEDADLQVLFGRLVSPFWDLQGGLRYHRPEPGAPSRAAAVFGVQGLAPYWFDVQAAAFVTHKGEISGRAEVEYDVLLTQRLIAQPRIEVNLAAQSVPEMGIGRGFNNAEMGLRLRYELKREFAPYVGFVWTSRFGQTADLARLEGRPVRNFGLVLGVRMWY